MKGRTISTIGIIAAVAGATLIFFRALGSDRVVMAGGILFVAVGLINMIFFSIGERRAKGTARILSIIANAGAIILGVSMLVFTATFTPLIPFVFGFLVGLCSLWQFYLLAAGIRPDQLPGWLYAFPMILAGATVYIILQHGDMAEITIMLVTGIALVLFGIGCVTEGSLLGAQRRKALRAATDGTYATTDDLDDTTLPQDPKESTKSNEISVNEKKSTK